MTAMPTTTERPALKDELLGHPHIQQLAEAAARIGVLQPERFLAATCEHWEELPILGRLQRLGAVLCAQLPADFDAMLQAAVRLGPCMPNSFAAMALCECATLRHHPDDDVTLNALAILTCFGSAEWALRPLLIRDPERVLRHAAAWARHDNAHVRRLASEGTRPRLPWSQRLDALAHHPEAQRPILDALRDDPSATVRRSVANHLNDMAKVNPDGVFALLSAWPSPSPATRALIRHALRTLIKQGEPRALAWIGAGAPAQLRVTSFLVAPSTLRLGEAVLLLAELTSVSAQPQTLEVDYAVHFVKKNGSTARKVFKLRRFTLAPGVTVQLTHRHRVEDFTTRRHHSGRHRVELLINGPCWAEGAFHLTV